MGGHKGRQLASKWVKTEALLSHIDIAPHIPPTKRFTAENLRSMLDAHHMVVVKPVVGAGGHGVIKVTKRSRGSKSASGAESYAFTYYAQTKRFASFAALIGALNKKRKGRAYLIQKGIDLATVDGRPIDYRVKYVKTEKGWVYRAIVGRIAKPGLFVTNLCRGGTLVKSAFGISRSISPAEVAEKKSKMRELTVLSTGVLEKKYPGIGQLGFDYGIDKQGKIWIFEVNTRPQ
ncbi:YheC/YheD family protein [Paenibacillus sp. N4]|uniref:YheC/YheD family protein n=1 Tax=Paenibacillus vietnamensis TaxID=2590547 RepID=UPI001CD08F79|nr:YheC/YheD family protein [Paenibacillus vietnamensis]MCA0755526.1 YheC/YheD family protein [Paenibacillus vietnamensis]